MRTEQHETVPVHARRWVRGWELYVLGNEDLITQGDDLEGAPRMARDYLETIVPRADFQQVEFEVVEYP